MEKTPKYIKLFWGMLLATAIAFLFHKYISGNAYFLFFRTINDVISQFYPQYYRAAELLEAGVHLPTYSFSNGWGGTQNALYLFDYIVIMFGKEHVIYMIGIVEVLKVISVAGVSFYLMRLIRNNVVTAVVGSLGMAFSTQVLIGGIWKSQAELTLFVLLGMIVVERIQKKKKWIGTGIFALLALIIAKFGISMYFQLVYGAFLFIYILGKIYITERDSRILVSKKKLTIFVIVGIILIATLIAVILHKMIDIISSYRFQSGMEEWGTKWRETFSKDNAKQIITAFFRSLSPSILGIGGIEAYYNAGPAAYCEIAGYYIGIFLLLMIPQTFCVANKKEKIVYEVGIFVSLSIICLPGVRLFANGFANDYFKLTRLIVTIIIFLIATKGMDIILECKKKFKTGLFVITDAVVVVIFLLFRFTKYKGKIYDQDLSIVVIFCIIYAIYVLLYKKMKGGKYKYILCIIFVIEMIAINYRYINNIEAITDEIWECNYYNDGTIEAVDKIKGNDDGFYRIEKAYRSALLDDASVQGYNGTTYYVGGVGNNRQTDLIVSLGMPTLWNQRGYCGGAYGNSAAEILFADKYILARYDESISYNYKKTDSTDSVNIFENEGAMSIGFAYDAVISKENFEQYDYQDRKDIILQNCVVENDSLLLNYMQNSTTPDVTKIEPKRVLELENYQLNTGIGIEPVGQNETIVVELENAEEECLNVVWSTADEAWSKNRERIVSIYKETGKAELVLNNQKDTSMFVIQPFSTKEITSVDRVSIKVYDTEDYYKLYNKSIKKLRENELLLEEYTDTFMCGTITLDSRKLLYLSIPFDDKWNIYVDGEKVEKYCVNYAFSGILVKSGTHTIEMKYEN